MIALLVCVVGLILYLATNKMPAPTWSSKVNIIGLHMFSIGLLALLLALALKGTIS